MSYNLRTYISSKTKELFRVGLDEQLVHKESTPARTKRDNMDEDKLVSVLQRLKVLASDRLITPDNGKSKAKFTDPLK